MDYLIVKTIVQPLSVETKEELYNVLNSHVDKFKENGFSLITRVADTTFLEKGDVRAIVTCEPKIPRHEKF